ncbi:efflux transporter outer membrane subunit [Rhodoferax sp. UBA5149]|uniref:efflux transporter outer membrane subunit n=1 Tax=Rhodoferax sp. UBA5149 TaxID=1947379 RepID=UPI0025DAC0B6|nr:efflux transporter outer membrane subunit [Rhodoferax sp. UBA5149]
MRLDHQKAGVRTRLTQSAVLIVAALGLSACASMSGIQAQATLRDAASLGLPVEPGVSVTLDAQWWREFGDEQLNRLVEQALATSPSLRIVQARMARAQAGVDVTDAASGPQLNAGIDATRQLFTANGLIPPPLAGKIYETGTAQFSGSWELDFFGKNRAALDAALGNARATQADADAARMLLASHVVRSYVQLVRLNEQLAVAQRLLAQRQQALHLVQDRVNAGLDTRLELRQSEGTLPDARLQIETLQEQLTLARNALSALVGQPNRAVAPDLPTLSAIKNIANAATLPSDLLGRRADIAAARWRVEAATQDVSSARSQFYPNINLVAFAGFSSIGLDRLLGAGSEQWGVGPALHLPLFDGGRLRANLRGKAAELDAAIESYNATVIDAVREAADQLASTQAIGRQQVEQRAAQSFAENAYDIAVQRYEAGLGNYLQVLTSETTVLSQRRQGVDLAARALDTQVALIRALGGGYRAELPAATAQK